MEGGKCTGKRSPPCYFPPIFTVMKENLALTACFFYVIRQLYDSGKLCRSQFELIVRISILKLLSTNYKKVAEEGDGKSTVSQTRTKGGFVSKKVGLWQKTWFFSKLLKLAKFLQNGYQTNLIVKKVIYPFKLSFSAKKGNFSKMK